MTRVAQDFDYWTGDDVDLVYTITDDTGASIDLSGYVCRWVLQDEYDSGSLLVYRTGGSGVAVSGCTATVSLAGSDTAAQTWRGDYYTELSASDTASNAAVLAVGTATVRRRAY